MTGGSEVRHVERSYLLDFSQQSTYGGVTTCCFLVPAENRPRKPRICGFGLDPQCVFYGPGSFRQSLMVLLFFLRGPRLLFVVFMHLKL